mmetsp:Transcript_13656/g.49681  ORF Transcript_13656/g.49681 Transcript_13656/m.49681 type:complete len:102 (+) Transcript_13656:45-350(+)
MRLRYQMVTVAAIALAGACAVEPAQPAEDGDLYLLFVQQWRPELCFQSEAPACKHYGDNLVTIHGIWPEFTNGSYPTYCTQEQLTEDIVAPIESELEVRGK